MWIVVEVLIETIRLLSGAPSIDKVMACLAKRGSSITREQVEQVFEEHNLEKKLWINCHPTFTRMSQTSRKATQSSSYLSENPAHSY